MIGGAGNSFFVLQSPPVDCLPRDGSPLGDVGGDALESSTSSDLLREVRDLSNDRAWRSFDARYRGVVERVSRRYGLSHQDAHDLAQDVMVALTKAMPRFEYRREQCRFRSFLERITKARMIDHWRRLRQHPTVELTDELVALASAGEPQEWETNWREETESVLILAALDRLSVERRLDLPSRAVLLELYVRRNPIEEAARRLGRKPQDLYRIRSRWKVALETVIRELRQSEQIP